MTSWKEEVSERKIKAANAPFFNSMETTYSCSRLRTPLIIDLFRLFAFQSTVSGKIHRDPAGYFSETFKRDTQFRLPTILLFHCSADSVAVP